MGLGEKTPIGELSLLSLLGLVGVVAPECPNIDRYVLIKPVQCSGICAKLGIYTERRKEGKVVG